MNQFPKIKTVSKDSFYYVDPTGLAPVLLLTKGSILLHEIRARIYGQMLTDLKQKQKPPKIGDLCLVSNEPVVHTNSAL